MIRTALPHHEEAEHEVDSWTADGIRYQLVERAGIYSLRIWDLYRFVVLESGGSQIIARRLAHLLNSEGAEIVELKRRRR